MEPTTNIARPYPSVESEEKPSHCENVREIGRFIPRSEAVSWAANYRKAHPGTTSAHLFGKDLLEKFLSREGVHGLRFYYAIDNDGKKPSGFGSFILGIISFLQKLISSTEVNKHLIVVGVNSKGEDLVPGSGHKEIAFPDSTGNQKQELRMALMSELPSYGDRSSPCNCQLN